MGLDNPLHIAFLLVILLLVFGAKRLPEMGRSLGEGLRGFKDSMSGEGAGSSAQQRSELSAAEPQASTVAPAVSAPAVSAPAVNAPVAVEETVAAAPRTALAEREQISRESELATADLSGRA